MSKKEGLSTESYKGVRDFYPEDQAVLNYITATMREVAERFGYVEYHASILEPSELYKAKGAENEEIISEQTYSFTDRGGREVTLRPEMTPTVAAWSPISGVSSGSRYDSTQSPMCFATSDHSTAGCVSTGNSTSISLVPIHLPPMPK